MTHYIRKFKGKEKKVRHQNIMNLILGFHEAINNNFWGYLDITFWQYLVMNLNIPVRFTLKEMKCEFSSYFGIISGSAKRELFYFYK